MKIKYFPCQPHCFAFGGFDLQMLNTLASVKKLGLDVSKIDYWDRDSDFDVIHLWGIGPHNYNVINWAKKSKKLVVATVLIPYYETIRLKLSYYKNYFTSTQNQLIYYYNQVDRIIVVNELQSKVLKKYYRVPSSKIDVIPNIVEDQYYQIPSFNFVNKYNISDYILCTGNISQRKNQLSLAQASIYLDLKLVLIGNVLEGEEIYAKELEKLIENSTNIIWIKELPNGSEELVSAYYNCSIFALPSLDETQPISLLEATAVKKPIVTLDKAYASQKYYINAIKSKSKNYLDIACALKIAKGGENITNTIIDCKSINVGASYLKLYNSLES